MHIVLLKFPHVQIAFLKFTSRVYSNCCCSCSFETEIIKIGQSSHQMYSNNILNSQESMTILNACKKSLETYWTHHVVFLKKIIDILIVYKYKKSDLDIIKNYRDITLIAITAKVYNVLLLNRIWSEVEKILRKIRTVFGEINVQIFTF